MNRRLRILLDVDGVLADFVALPIAYEEERCRTRTRDSITEYDIFKAWVIPEEWQSFNRWLAPGHCAGMSTLPGAVEFVRDLRELGDVAIVTSPYKGIPTWIWERIKWLERHFGIAQSDVCCWGRKHWIDGDILIDDAWHNVEKFQGLSLLVEQPWNRAPEMYARPSIERVKSFEGILQSVSEIRKLWGYQ